MDPESHYDRAAVTRTHLAGGLGRPLSTVARGPLLTSGLGLEAPSKMLLSWRFCSHHILLGWAPVRK